MVVRLSAVHEGREVNLLWRESAEHVGEIRKALGGSQGKAAENLINVQHEAAQNAYASLMTSDAKHSTDIWAANSASLSSEVTLSTVLGSPVARTQP